MTSCSLVIDSLYADIIEFAISRKSGHIIAVQRRMQLSDCSRRDGSNHSINLFQVKRPEQMTAKCPSTPSVIELDIIFML